jgi:hypothetical protein
MLWDYTKLSQLPLNPLTSLTPPLGLPPTPRPLGFSQVTIKTRAELISALARLYAARRSAFDEADLRSLLALLDGLCRAPFNDGEAAAAAAQANAGLGAAGLPPVQRAVLEFLPQWGPLDDRHVRAGLWSATFQMLLAYLPGEPPGASASLGARAVVGLELGVSVRVLSVVRKKLDRFHALRMTGLFKRG